MAYLLNEHPAALPPTAEPADGDTPTIFSILATQARAHARPELWMTALGGATNVVLICSQHPRLFWIAAGFATVTSYGVWGLADDALNACNDVTSPVKVNSLLGLRVAAAVIGVGGSLLAVAGFMRAAIGNWIS